MKRILIFTIVIFLCNLGNSQVIPLSVQTRTAQMPYQNIQSNGFTNYNHMPVAMPDHDTGLIDIVRARDFSKTEDFVKAINDLAFISKNGLFIRLKTYDQAVKGLQSAGRFDIAEKLLEKQHDIDSSILEAFREQFTFTKVYYFYSRDIRALKNGDFSKAFNLDGSPVNYSEGNFYMINPYDATVPTMGLELIGFSLLDSASTPMHFPSPTSIVKRYFMFYKTYPQLVFDWNYEFMEVASFVPEFSKLVPTPADIKSTNERTLNQRFRVHSKAFHKNYDFSGRPEKTNRGY